MNKALLLSRPLISFELGKLFGECNAKYISPNKNKGNELCESLQIIETLSRLILKFLDTGSK